MTLCHIPDCSCINPVPKPEIFNAVQCEECKVVVKMSSSESFTELNSYGYYIGHHEKWVCRRCFKELELKAHNEQRRRMTKK